ncbi:MAG: CocE/NonD family hydrolase [Bacteroidota bacterium]
MQLLRSLTTLVCLFFFSLSSLTAQSVDLATFIKQNYTKQETYIQMRDGTRLFTAIFTPKDATEDNQYPILMKRTCYSIAPYGVDAFPETRLGPSPTLTKDKFIFVLQDVRGRYMSEGRFTNMTPHIPKKKKKKKDVDESTDTYDTIDWLLANVSFHNGRVGQWGVSYPGFYTTAGSINAHPALKASSPQAPIADFFFDDFHHNGAYTLGYFWNTPLFGIQKDGPQNTSWFKFFERPTLDGYQFFMDLGSLKNADKYYGEENFFWQELSSHPNYDEFWQKRRIIDHLKDVKHAVMVVGGWFDAEDLYGPLNTYRSYEDNNPGTYKTIVMGPFGHGDWAREKGHHTHHHLYFGDSISTWYQRNIEAKFFNHFLKGAGDGNTGLPEAFMYNTGLKKWEEHSSWPPKTAETKSMFLRPDGNLNGESAGSDAFSEFVSDPAHPVPYTWDVPGSFGITMRNYMSEDQRFASRRPDVLVFQTEILGEDMTLSGPLDVNLQVSTTGTDADWVVKLIDVYPDDEPNTTYTPAHVSLNSYQQMVRSEIMRSRFRNSFEKPEPLTPNEITPINFKLQDVNHTFKKGHRIMVQVQSSWFPAFDRNPQKYVPNIFEAEETDFIKATHRVYGNSKVELMVRQ